MIFIYVYVIVHSSRYSLELPWREKSSFIAFTINLYHIKFDQLRVLFMLPLLHLHLLSLIAQLYYTYCKQEKSKFRNIFYKLKPVLHASKTAIVHSIGFTYFCPNLFLTTQFWGLLTSYYVALDLSLSLHVDSIFYYDITLLILKINAYLPIKKRRYMNHRTHNSHLPGGPQ